MPRHDTPLPRSLVAIPARASEDCQDFALIMMMPADARAGQEIDEGDERVCREDGVEPEFPREGADSLGRKYSPIPFERAELWCRLAFWAWCLAS